VKKRKISKDRQGSRTKTSLRKERTKAADMASREIDKLGDRTATNDERADRKRKLILGPKEFRGMRRK
jgi:hypothetical protein